MPEKKDKQVKKPDFHIFLEGPEGTRYAGYAYMHTKGSGFGFTLAGLRYVAFASKS